MSILEYRCGECDATHTIDMNKFQWGDGQAYIKSLAQDKKYIIIGDDNTLKASEKVINKLDNVQLINLSEQSSVVEPSLETADYLKQQLSDEELLIACGTGSIGDLTKYVATGKGIPYALFFTAVSINGVATNKAVMIEGDKKNTHNVNEPVALICDEGVINTAPKKLNSFGYADIMCVPFCIADWKIAYAVKGVSYCSFPEQVWKKYEKELLKDDAHTNLQLLAEASYALSVAANQAGTSFPLSAGEHAISYFLDEHNQSRGKDMQPHGMQVGLASIISAELYQRFQSGDFSFRKITEGDFGTSSRPEEALTKKSKLTNIIENTAQRYEKIVIARELINKLPSAQIMKNLLGNSGALPQSLPVDKEVLTDAIIHAAALKDNKYTILNAMLDSGNLSYPVARQLVRRHLC